MSRSTKVSESPAPFAEDIYSASPEPNSRRQTNNATQQYLSPSPATSVSSDKENRSSRGAVDKGKGRAAMGPPAIPKERSKRRRATESDPQPERSRRRRTVEVQEDTSESSDVEVEQADRSRSRRRETVEVEEDSDVEYDPEQDLDERRRLRKGLRDLNKKLLDNRSEALNAKSTLLKDTLLEANRLSSKVKQTSDATIDSRLLVTTADYSYKKTVALISGDTAQGIDIEDFLNKCKNFMRQGDSPDNASSTQRHRRRDQDDEDEDDDGVLNWAYFGRQCLKHNSRPSVPGFLLGPLSLEKRARKAVVRKAALRPNTIKETRPEVLNAGDIEKSENANLTTLCNQILKRLQHIQEKNMEAAEREAHPDMTSKEEEALMDRYSISRDGGIALFKFVINPHSFGQTIENMFYVSFLIRDGAAGISTDDRGMPYLNLTGGSESSDEPHKGSSKHQAVLALDMTMWKELIDAFDIKEPMIKHREEEEHRNVGAKGWYA